MTQWWIIALLITIMILVKPVTSWIYDQHKKWSKKHYSVDAVNKRQKYINLEELKWR